MLTVKQQSKFMDRIKSMSELELQSFMEDLEEYLEKNRMSHLIEDVDLIERVYDLENEANGFEQKASDLEETISDIENLCDSLLEVEEFEDGAFAELTSGINKIKNLC